MLNVGIIFSVKILKKNLSITASGLTITNNEVEDVIKVIRSLGNKEILWKRTTEKNICQKGRFRIFLGQIITFRLPLVKNVFTSLAKRVLLPLKLMTATSAIYVAIQKKTHKSGMTTLIISNEEMNDIMKIVKYLEGSDSLKKSASKAIEHEAVEQSGGCFGTLLAMLGASL